MPIIRFSKWRPTLHVFRLSPLCPILRSTLNNHHSTQPILLATGTAACISITISICGFTMPIRHLESNGCFPLKHVNGHNLQNSNRWGMCWLTSLLKTTMETYGWEQAMRESLSLTTAMGNTPEYRTRKHSPHEAATSLASISTITTRCGWDRRNLVSLLPI